MKLNRRKLNKNCLYNHDHGYDMKCIQLQDNIEEFICHDRLDRFLYNRRERCDAQDAPPHLPKPSLSIEEVADRLATRNVNTIITGLVEEADSNKR